MKNIKFKQTAAALILPAVLIASPAMAADKGQFEGGDIFRIKNVTQNVDFTDPASAKACDVLEYKVRIHNPGPSVIDNVMVQANVPSGNLPSNRATILVSSTDASPQSVSDAAVANFDQARSETYVSGSTQLLDANGNVISSLPDGITSGGVNIGTVAVSINNKRYVQFQEKVNCPVTPNVTPPTVTTASAPAALPQTGPENALAGLAGTGALGYAVMQYRRSRKALVDKLRNRK